MNELKPCPFCGEESEFDLVCGTVDREGVPIHLTCVECGASGPWTYCKDLRESIMRLNAEAKWNNRV